MQVEPSLGVASSTGVGHGAPKRPTKTPGSPIYPAVDQGLIFAEVDEVMATQEPLLRRLKLLAALPEEEYEIFFLSVIRNLALHINHLPASEHGTHNGAGGLFRLALEIAFFSFQASEARLFAAREGLEDRRKLEPRWRYATFLAGLCSELHRPITSMVVVTSSGEEWPSYQKSLGEWLSEKEADRFFVRWLPLRKNAGAGAASYLLYKIIPEKAIQFLHEGSPHIFPTLIDVVTGSVDPIDPAPMQRIIDEVRNKVFERDAALRPAQYGKLTVGSHIEPHLLDAMRRLIVDGVWLVNAPKSRLWYGEEGLFLVWRTAAKEIIERLQRDGITGVPQDPQTLLELLLQIRVFSNDSDGSPYWTIISPLTSSELLAVKFESPLTVLAALTEEPTRVGSLLKKSAPVVNVGSHSIPSVIVVEESVNKALEVPILQEKGSQQQNCDYGQASSGGAIEATVEKPSGAELPDDLMAKVSPLTRDVLSALLEDHRANKTKGATGKTENAFGIGMDQLAGYGADAMTIITDLSKAGWLYTLIDKPNKKIHQVEINQKPLSAILLKMAAARDLGFIK